jgi:predicted metal-dependent hydrolase
MVAKIDLGETTAEVVKKDIKNAHLSVHPPTGKVRISAPLWMKLDTIRVFAISKIEWIKKQQRRMREQERETPREYLDRESHYVWGKRYLLDVVERDGRTNVELRHNKMIVSVRRGTGSERKQAIVDEWYRHELKEAILPLIEKWEPPIGVHTKKIYVRRMKTKWGSCNIARKSIRLNTELAKLVHLLEPTYNKRFIAHMNEFMPKLASPA